MSDKWEWVEEKYVKIENEDEKPLMAPPPLCAAPKPENGPEMAQEGIVAEDQCPDCRCAPGEPHSPFCEGDAAHEWHTVMLNTDQEYVNIPLHRQLEIFEQRKWEVVEQMRQDLDNPIYLDLLFTLARKRLTSGFKEYGSTMYGWSVEARVRNEDEEMADRLVYGTSEP